MEGTPADSVAPTRLTQCRTSEGLIELYLPSKNEILRARPSPPADTEPEAAVPGTSDTTVYYLIDDGTIVIERGGHPMTPDELDALSDDDLVAIKQAASKVAAAAAAELPDPGPAPDWLTEDIVAAFRKDAVRAAGTLVFEGHEYTLLLTDDPAGVTGSNAVLVDPSTGEGAAWIPDPRAFGVPTIVVRTSETLRDDADSAPALSLTKLHPDAVVRDLSPPSSLRQRGAVPERLRGAEALPVERRGVVVHDLVAPALGQPPEHEGRLVGVPVRIVGREAEVVGSPCGLEHLEQQVVLPSVCSSGCVVKRCARGRPRSAAGRARVCRRVARASCRRAARGSRQPGQAAFEQQHPQLRQALEDPSTTSGRGGP